MTTDNIANAITNIGSDITNQLKYIREDISSSSNLDEITSSLKDIGSTLTEIRQALVVLSLPAGRRDAQREYYKLQDRKKIYEYFLDQDDIEEPEYWKNRMSDVDAEIQTLITTNRIV